MTFSGLITYKFSVFLCLAICLFMESEISKDRSTVAQSRSTHPTSALLKQDNLLSPGIGNHWKEAAFADQFPAEGFRRESAVEQEKPRTGGTDPTKYKTAICRNWETTGTCNFRGCTFAHGREELRPIRSSTMNEHVSGVTELKPGKPNTSLSHGRSFIPTESKEQSWSHVDQALHELYDAIRRERANYTEQTQGNYALGIMLRREQMYKVQREKDQQDIIDLQERVQHLEKIIVQLHIERQLPENGKDNSQKRAEALMQWSPLSNEALSGNSASAVGDAESKQTTESTDNSSSHNANVDGQSLMLLSLLKSASRVPAGL